MMFTSTPMVGGKLSQYARSFEQCHKNTTLLLKSRSEGAGNATFNDSRCASDVCKTINKSIPVSPIAPINSLARTDFTNLDVTLDPPAPTPNVPTKQLINKKFMFAKKLKSQMTEIQIVYHNTMDDIINLLEKHPDCVPSSSAQVDEVLATPIGTPPKQQLSSAAPSLLKSCSSSAVTQKTTEGTRIICLRCNTEFTNTYTFKRHMFFRTCAKEEKHNKKRGMNATQEHGKKHKGVQ